MTSIVLREPPARTASGRRPVMPLDARILKVAQSPMRPVEISRAIRDEFPEATTQRVASRLKALTARGLVVRHRPSGGPANGPGTSLYQAKQDGDSSSDG